MTFVLDTSALWHPPLLEAMIEIHAFQPGKVQIVLPAVAYAERRRQLLRDGRDVGAWAADLAEADIVVEPLGLEETRRIPAVADDLWDKHARDHLVAAHVGPGRVGITADEGPVWREVPCIHPDTAVDFLESILDGTGRGRTRDG